MSILDETIEEIKGIVYTPGPLTAEQVKELRLAVAGYGLACVHDSAVCREAEKACEENNAEV